MAHINPYLHFNGRCREAMSFYHQCLGGELMLQKIAESPMAARMPSEMDAQILHGSLVKDGLVLLASDLMGTMITPGNSVALCINCSSSEELNEYFERLSAGGNIIEPLHQSYRGSTSGKLTDRFGIQWIFNYAKN